MAKKDGKKYSVKRVFENNLFALKLIHEAAPFLTAAFIIDSILQSLINVISNAYLLRYAINGIEEGLTFSRITTVILIWMAVRIVFWIAKQFFNYKYVNIASLKVSELVSRRLLEHAEKCDLDCYENPEFYDKLAKALDGGLNSVFQVQSSLIQVVYFIVSFSANTLLVILIDPVLLIFSLIPLLALPLNIKRNKLNYDRDMESTVQNRRSDYSLRTFYLADYAKEMRLSGMPTFMLDRFVESGRKILEIIRRYGVRLAVINYATNEIQAVVTTLGATMYSVWKTLVVGTMGLGDCLVILNSLNMITYVLSNSSNYALQFHNHALYIDNLRDFLDYQPRIVDGAKPLPDDGDLVLDNVSFKYSGAENYTLKNLSLHIKPHEKVAIVGHNGAGKTTLVKLLLRLYDADSGSVSYGGVDVRDLPVKAYRDIFGSVMQDYHVFALSVAENVLRRARTSEDSDDMILDALDKAGFSGKLSTFEQGIDTQITKEFAEDGENLSGGEAQKLAISSIYAKDNRFVILDEPSSALDPIAEHEMYENMLRACGDCGVIFISHRLSSAVSADRIYLIEDGSVAESGSHEELMRLGGKYAQMFRHQAENYVESKEVAQ